MKKISLSLIALLTLTNCSVYEDSFKCPIGKGEACKSLSYVDQKVDQGAYSDSEETFKKTCSKNRCQSMTLFFPGRNQRMTVRSSETKG